MLNKIFTKKEKLIQLNERKKIREEKKEKVIENSDDDQLGEEDLDEAMENIGQNAENQDLQEEEDDEEEEKDLRSMSGLILLPTRELALQVDQVLQAILKCIPKSDPYHIKPCMIVGGLSSLKQERLLGRSPDLLISTIGRLWDLIEDHNKDLMQLPGVNFLILDEVDRIIDLGLYTELEKILKFLDDP